MQNITPAQLRAYQNLNSRIMKKETLTEAEEGWRLETKLALADGRPVEDPPWFSEQAPEKTAPAVSEAAETVEADKAVAEDLGDHPEEPLDPKQVHDQFQEALYKIAETQGLTKEIEEAKAKWGEVYLNATDGKVFAFRPFLFEDANIVSESARAIDNHKAVAERCVVAGGKQLFGKMPKFGIYTTVYNLVMDVSAPEPEVDFIIKA